MKPRAWHFITGEFPPQPGGVSDYCAQLATALVEAGDEVHVWAPRFDQTAPSSDGVRVHRLRSHFGIGSLRELDAAISACAAPRRLIVQYVAGAFGYHAMNVPFCTWLFCRRAEPTWVMFHEFAYPLGWRLKPSHNLLGLVTPMMGAMLAARADRILVSTTAWERRIPGFTHPSKPVTWLPVPSNIPLEVGADTVARVRQRITGGRAATIIGHFGTYGAAITASLTRIIPPLLHRDPARIALLLGRGSEAYAAHLAAAHPVMRGRIVAAGALPGDQLAAHLRACDILVQPYPDGATSRRGSLMAGLALGMPIVTNEGESAEPFWREERAVALAPDPSPEPMVVATDELLASPAARRALAARGADLYRRRFTLEHTVRALRSLALEDDGAEGPALSSRAQTL